MKSRVLLATLLAASSGLAADRWTSPDNFYSITPPSGWSYREDTPGGHRSFAWISSDQKAEIRISATYNLARLQRDLPDLIVDAFFPDERGITQIEKVNGTGWDGLRREYINADQSTRWLGVAARKDFTIVGITMSAPASDFERFRPIFESVWQSLKLGELLDSTAAGGARELVSDSDADEFAQLALHGMWGKALDEHDRSLQPKDDADRHTIPIPLSDVRRVARAGAPAGIASWAGLDWQIYYDAFMKQERRSGRWSGKQIAFIGMLFGVAQGSFEKACEKIARDQNSREWAADVLAEAKRKFL